MVWRPLLLLALVAVASAAQVEKPNLCQECRKIVSLAERFNTSTKQQELSTVLENFCELYYEPSTDFQKGPCPVFVRGLLYVINNTNPTTHCDDINVCGPRQPSDDIYQYMESSNSNTASELKRGPNVICDYCVDMVEQFKAFVSDPAKIRKVHEQADALCAYLKVIDADKECRESVHQYVDYAVGLVRSIDSKDYCSSIRMCPRRPPGPPPANPRQLPTLADFNNFGIETAVSIGPKPLVTLPENKMKGPECSLCKTIVKEMFHFLRENKTEENIINGLNHVCQVIYPKEPKLGQCRSMVKAYTRELVQLLIDETNPELICMLLDQCAYSERTALSTTAAPKPELTTQTIQLEDASEAISALAQLISELEPSVLPGSARSCLECRMFIKYLRDKLENPQSQAEIKQFLLENLCKQLPDANLVKSCSSMIETYSDVFFKAIAGDLNPRTACVEMGVCEAKRYTEVFDLVPAENAGATQMLARAKVCTRCTDVVSFMDDYLADHPKDKGLAVSKVCEMTDIFAQKSHCLAYMKVRGADILQKLPTMESPRHLCKQIAQC